MTAATFSGPSAVRRDADQIARRKAAYRAALRHSRFVRLLKWAIPLGAGFATIFVMVIMIFDPFRKLPQGLNVAGVGLSGSRIVMEAPRLQGYRADSRPYEVTAKAASQDIKTPHLIDLTDIDARVALGPDGQARLQSPEGALDSQKELLELRQAVRVTTDHGYDVRLKSARIEFKTGYVRSDESVSMRMNDGTVESDTLEIVDGGQKVVFGGRVRSVLTPRDPASAGQAGEEKKR